MTDVFNINYSSIFGGEKATRPNRKLRAAQKQESLTLPAHYQEIPEEGMYYEGGGFSMRTDIAGWILDGALLLTGVGIAFGVVKVFGKVAVKKFVKKFVSSNIGNICKWIGVGGTAASILVRGIGFLDTKITNLTSIGGIVASIFDIADGSWDGRISF